MKSGRAMNNFFRYLAEPRTILAEPLGSAEPRLKNTGLDCIKLKKVRFGSNYYFFNIRGFFRLWNIFGVQTEDCSKGRLKKKKVV